jgi:hypothetical protein
MAVFVSIFADLFADLTRSFMRMGQKVKEYSVPSEAWILPMFLPIAEAHGVGQVRVCAHVPKLSGRLPSSPIRSETSGGIFVTGCMSCGGFPRAVRQRR